MPLYSPEFLCAFHVSIFFCRALLPSYISEHCCLHTTQPEKHSGLHTLLDHFASSLWSNVWKATSLCGVRTLCDGPETPPARVVTSQPTDWPTDPLPWVGSRYLKILRELRFPEANSLFPTMHFVRLWHWPHWDFRAGEVEHFHEIQRCGGDPQNRGNCNGECDSNLSG